MVKITFAEFEDGLAEYRLGYFAGAMYAQVKELAWVTKEPFKLNSKKYAVGETFTQLGKQREATIFEMQDGHWLEYAGKIDTLLLFKADGESNENVFYAFFQVEDRLCLTDMKGNARDIW